VPNAFYPTTSLRSTYSDSLINASKLRLAGTLSNNTGYENAKRFKAVRDNAAGCGAGWYSDKKISEKTINAKANDAAELKQLLQANAGKKVTISLTGNAYQIDQPLMIDGQVTLTSANKNIIFSAMALPYLIQIKGGSRLTIDNLNIDLATSSANAFITSDVSGSSGHSQLLIMNSRISNVTGDVFYSAKSTMLDSVYVSGSTFNNVAGTVFNFNTETDKKGYYTVEKLTLQNNHFTNNKGQLLLMLRGGNDESTMGPLLQFTNNTIESSGTISAPLISLFGTQISNISNNSFSNAAALGTLIKYEDNVRAAHLLSNNKFVASGNIVVDKFVEQKNNITQ